jgi:hypothetical protein
MKKILVTTACVFLISCANTPTERDTTVRDAQGNYRTLQQALDRLPNKKSSCSTSTFELAESSANLLETRMMRNYNATIDPRYSSTQKRSIREQLDVIIPLAANGRLDLADKASALGCKKAAKEHYNSILKTFVGTGYTSYRDRAKVGLADLR